MQQAPEVDLPFSTDTVDPCCATLPTLTRLLGDLTPDQFRQIYYGRSPLLLRGHVAWAREIFTWSDLNHLLNTSVIPHSTMRLSRKGAPSVEVSDALSVIEACRQGSSLVINTIHLFSQSIGRFSRALERDLGEPINVNMYLSSADNPAFACHYDCHDIMLLQLEGHKRWKVFEPTIQSPLFDMKHHGVQAPSEPILDVTLAPGDFLYVPRGFWHEVVAVGGLSLHLTVGIDAHTGIDFLRWLADEFRDELLFRQTLPLIYDGESESKALAARQQHVLKLRDAIMAKLSEPSTLRAYRTHFVATRKDPEQFKFPSHLEDRPASSRQVRNFRRPMYQLAELSEGQGSISITCLGRVLSFPLPARPVLEAVIARDRVSLEELQAVANGLTEPAIWAILDSLCREGILEGYDS
ncbi:MAG TPA: cupin domain-containing protein [Verrucomicrobiae bacterium]